MTMTPRRQADEERHAALMAVAHSLTEAERVLFLGRVARDYPRLQGAQVADVLDLTNDHDMFLDRTEVFFEQFADQVPDSPALIFAAHLIILMGWGLTPARVCLVLQRAGVVDVPRYPEVEVGLIVAAGGLRAHPDQANHLTLMARAEQGMRAAGVPEDVITEFRETVRRTDTPGYSRNVGDIARWVTFVDRYTEMPRKVYDPTDDLAAVLTWVGSPQQEYEPEVSRRSEVALRNLRSHMDFRSPETIKASLLPFYGRTPE